MKNQFIFKKQLLTPSLSTRVLNAPVKYKAALRLTRMLGIVLVCAAATGCSSNLVKESDMKNPAELARLAQKDVTIVNNLQPKLTKVAIIGVNANRFDREAKHTSRFDPSASIRNMISGIQNNVDAGKQITCQALNSVFDTLQPALEAAGFQVVSVTDKLNSDAYRGLSENYGGSLMCAADKARVTMMSMVIHNFSDSQLTEFREKIGKLMDDTGVDGVLIALFTSNGMTVGESNLVMLTKGVDGSVRGAWQAKLKKGSMRFEPVVKKPRDDDEHIENIARVYNHSFVVLATRLAEDTKK